MCGCDRFDERFFERRFIDKRFIADRIFEKRFRENFLFERRFFDIDIDIDERIFSDGRF